MAKITITIPDDLEIILRELATDSGDSLSSVASDCIKFGIMSYLEPRLKMQVYRNKRDEAKEKKEKKKNGEKTTDD